MSDYLSDPDQLCFRRLAEAPCVSASASFHYTLSSFRHIQIILQMARYSDYEIRLFGPQGELQRVIPLVAESENIARMRAALLCSEHGAESFEVYLEKQAPCFK